MSNAWAGGSTSAWRKVRLLVLIRDGWVCRLCGEAINPSLRTPHPRSAEVHHVRGKEYGDDPRYLIACHRECNLKLGDPNKHDPRPRKVDRW